MTILATISANLAAEAVLLRERVNSFLPDFGDGAEMFADADDLQEACMGSALPAQRPVDPERIILMEPAPKDACMGELLLGK